MRILALVLLLAIVPTTAIGFSSGSPVCDVEANFGNVNGMLNRQRIFSAGPYVANIDVPGYTPGVPIDIEISGPRFLGLMVTVVDAQGNKVGTFSGATNIRNCGGAMAVTHSTRLNDTTKTLTWNPPAVEVGTVYVEAYILEGAPGGGASQVFYRMVLDDGSALAIDLDNDTIFKNRFEVSGFRGKPNAVLK
ncbi:MAG: Reeler domain-containing protein [Pseudomonadota bacterium]